MAIRLFPCLRYARYPIFVLAALSAISSVRAQDNADRGLSLAARWCNSCHVVQQNDPGMDDGEVAPPFSTLTTVDTRTLKKLLRTGHADMDALSRVSDDDIADIAAHLHRLKPQPRTR